MRRNFFGELICPSLPVVLALFSVAAPAADPPARFVGNAGCATSLCHGGAGELRLRFL